MLRYRPLELFETSALSKGLSDLYQRGAETVRCWMKSSRMFYNHGIAATGRIMEWFKDGRCSAIWIRAPRFVSFNLRVKIFASMRKDHWVELWQSRRFKFLVINSWNPSSSVWVGARIHVTGKMEGGLPRMEISVWLRCCGRVFGMLRGGKVNGGGARVQLWWPDM